MHFETRVSYIESSGRLSIRMPKELRDKRMLVRRDGASLVVYPSSGDAGVKVKVPNFGEDRFGYIMISSKKYGLNLSSKFTHYENVIVNDDGVTRINLPSSALAVPQTAPQETENFVVTKKATEIVDNIREAVNIINDAIAKYKLKISVSLDGKLKATMEI